MEIFHSELHPTASKLEAAAADRWAFGGNMQNNRRQFYIYDLEICTRKAGATAPTMNAILPAFTRLHAAGKTYAIRADSATMLIGDIEIDLQQQLVTLLVRLSDTSTPNSVYSDPAVGSFDEHVKLGSVGSDFGCHVIISTAPEQAQANTYTCAIERIPGLPPALVQRLLSKFLNYEYHEVASSFMYPAPGGGLTRAGLPRTERCCPYIELHGRPSDTLITDINAGRISGISLVKSEQVTPIAGAPYLNKKSSELKLEVDVDNLPEQIWNSLTGVFRRNSGQYNVAKVTYRVPNSHRVVTVDIDTATATPLTDMYVLSFELINISPFLAQSAMAIVPHLKNLAVPQFLAHRTI